MTLWMTTVSYGSMEESPKKPREVNLVYVDDGFKMWVADYMSMTYCVSVAGMINNRVKQDVFECEPK